MRIAKGTTSFILMMFGLYGKITTSLPYRLQRSNEDGEVIVNKQVGIPFSIGKYEDLVLCDVAHNGACHIIWVVHGNMIKEPSMTVVLSSLSPKQVKEDQRRLREKLERGEKRKHCVKNKSVKLKQGTLLGF
ncbi:hypothetical protein Lal_00044306 [Lupinus albus]|nr:hypothetical protein Lal_00044306 [Lupinus albus]